MPQSRSGRIAFALFIFVGLCLLGRNLYRRYLTQALTAAIVKGDIKAARSLLDRGASVNSPSRLASDSSASPLSLPPLAWAMQRLNRNQPESEAMACLLIERGASVRPVARSVRYLQAACSKGSLTTLRCLLNHGADLSSPAGEAAIQAALDHVHYIAFSPSKGLIREPQSQQLSQQMIRLLYAYGAQPTLLQAVQLGDIAAHKARLDAGVPADQHEQGGLTAFSMAAEAGRLDMVKLLAAHGANIDYQSNYGGETALLTAARANHADIVKWLLAQVAKVNVMTRNVESPLQAALFYRRMETVWLLLAHGADPILRAEAVGYTPLSLAVYKMPQLVPELLRYGANVNDGQGAPLRAALYRGRFDLAQEFLRRGAQLNPARPVRRYLAANQLAPDEMEPFSPLLVAAFAAPQYVPTLQQAGAKLDAIDKQIAAGLALKAKRTDLLPQLLKLGANINGMDRQGYTALMKAAERWPSAVQPLLELGADPNVSGPGKHTALQLAVISTNAESVRLLLARDTNVNDTSRGGHTPLHWAQRRKRLEIAALLEQAGGRDE